MSVTRRALSANEPRSNRGLQTLRNHSSLGTQPWNMRQKILAVNSEFQNLDLTGESIVLTTESILERPKTKKREPFPPLIGIECKSGRVLDYFSGNEHIM